MEKIQPNWVGEKGECYVIAEATKARALVYRWNDTNPWHLAVEAESTETARPLFWVDYLTHKTPEAAITRAKQLVEQLSEIFQCELG